MALIFLLKISDGNDCFCAFEEANAEERDLIKRLNEMNNRERTRLPSLRSTEKGNLYAAAKKVDMWRSHGKVNKGKQTIYYIQICINSLDFTNDPSSLHNYIRN